MRVRHCFAIWIVSAGAVVAVGCNGCTDTVGTGNHDLANRDLRAGVGDLGADQAVPGDLAGVRDFAGMVMPDLANSACPPYTSLCGGFCIPTSNDPLNCGGCGIQCGVGGSPPNCSASRCSATCLAPLTACSGMCVDTQTDNNHCGGTCAPCPPNQGCVSGMCVPTTAPTPPPGMCVNGGPPITVVNGMQQTCSGSLAQVTFRWAICSCTNVDISNPFMTDGYDSTMGPYMPGATIAGRGCPNDGVAGQVGGGVGVNGSFSTSALADVWGTLWATGGIPSNAGVNAKLELHSGAQITGSTTVGSDGYVIGPFSGSGSFGRNLNAPMCPAPAAYTVGGTCIANPAMTVPPPCDCSPGQLIPVKSIVAARQAMNDNAQLTPPLDAAMFAAPGSSRRLDLPCGSYYLTNIAGGGGAVTIVAHGNTALYIGGDAIAGASLTFTLDPGASFDVFIAGAICNSNTFNVGSPNYPARMRIYVGGTSTCNVPGVTTPIYSLFLDNQTNVAGNVYAPYGQYFSGANILQYGGIFAGSFVNTNNTCIHYDRAVASAGQSCPPPPPPAPDGGNPPDGSVPRTGCGSCRDCGNQACINGTCAMCTSSAQCCPPLVCVGGTCQIIPPII